MILYAKYVCNQIIVIKGLFSMAKVGAQRAADITGISKSTIQRAMKSGKLSFSMDANGYRAIDVSELDRVYGLNTAVTDDGRPVSNATATVEGSASVPSVAQELAKANTMIEMERMKMKIYMLEKQLEVSEAQISDLKDQRDQWQKQASQVLITSEYSQKQAEELKDQIRQRDERVRQARERRDQHKLSKTKSMSDNAVKRAGKSANKSQQVEDSFVDNTRSYTDLTEDARIAAELNAKRGGGLFGFVKRITNAA